VAERVRKLNSVASIHPTDHSCIDMKHILDLRAFEGRDALHAATTSATANPAASNSPKSDNCAACASSDHKHSHSHSHSHTHPHTHLDHGITTVTLEPRAPGALDITRLRVWLGELLWTDIYEQPQSSATASSASAVTSTAAASSTPPASSTTPPSSTSNPASAAAPDTRPFIFRMKGILHLADEAQPHFLQAVQFLFVVFAASAY
jgi:G3E family GTPase